MALEHYLVLIGTKQERHEYTEAEDVLNGFLEKSSKFKDRRRLLREREIVIGRVGLCDVQVPDHFRHVSGYHGKLIKKEGEDGKIVYVFIDLSSNGTDFYPTFSDYQGGKGPELLHKNTLSPRELRSGNVISLGGQVDFAYETLER